MISIRSTILIAVPQKRRRKRWDNPSAWTRKASARNSWHISTSGGSPMRWCFYLNEFNSYALGKPLWWYSCFSSFGVLPFFWLKKRIGLIWRRSTVLCLVEGQSWSVKQLPSALWDMWNKAKLATLFSCHVSMCFRHMWSKWFFQRSAVFKKHGSCCSQLVMGDI